MKNNDLVNKLKEVFESVLPSSSEAGYPKEAMPLGTIVRSTRLNNLGFITDAFYGDIDEDNQKIIVYTLFLLPKLDPLTKMPKANEQYYISNEYEYEVIGYLMMKPVNLNHITKIMKGGMYL